MKTNLSKLWRRLPILVIITVLATFAVWVITLWKNLPHNDIREGIALDKAQSLVIFPICTPAYIPQGINANPQIIYDADDARVPEVTYIRLRYKRIDDQRLVFEVYQVYTRLEGMNPEFSESRVQRAEVSLLYWMDPSEFASESKLEIARKRAQMEAIPSQISGTVWWLYEIVDPSEYSSTMTEWINNHVEYRVLSYLPAEEIKKVTLAMLECSAKNP